MKTALVIPAYKPDEKMIALLEQFRGNEAFLPVVVDDGSGAEYEKVFAAVPDFCILLRHDVNRGKGAALKTAMQHILKELPDCSLALTADADGQHRYADILRVNAAARENMDALMLGSRKFEGEVPFRSRFGNGLTRQVFAIASGRKVHDTQTGLRAFGRNAMEKFIAIPGDRYEYEINMLLTAVQAGMDIREIWIETVYLNDNETSHFNPLRDSFKIYACILKFCASSLIAFAIDYAMFMLLCLLTAGMGGDISLLLSTVGARIVSAAVNFWINRSLVFKGNESLGRSLAKYAALAICVLAANYGLMRLLTLHLGWAKWISKILVELLLYTLSFAVQGKIVYRKRQAKG